MTNQSTPADASTPNGVSCSFCGKHQKEVKKIVAGPSVYICDECVGLCNDIIAEEVEAADAAAAAARPEPMAAAELLTELDMRVVGQTSAKRTLVAAVRQQQVLDTTPALRVLLVGPSGSGKTTLGRALVDSVRDGCMTDVGRLSESGYVGDDVEHVLCGLLDRANGEVERAQHGVLFLDGIEKLHAQRPLTRARDISGESVQRELLRVLESGLLYLPKSGGGRHPQRAGDLEIDTRHILIVAAVRTEGWDLPADLSERALRDALCEAGLLNAFVARFDRVIRLDRLGGAQMKSLAAGLIAETCRRAATVGTTLYITPDAVQVLASFGARSPDGAWALRAPLHRILEDVLLATPPVAAQTIDQAQMALLVGAR